ncbi:sulfatase [Blastopirellula sp. JC732]|uniref:Sulfatase n=1 Tax=Blastopirellula sediminis TaxID=2894196 RepID=A0A9X1MT39_9BACT|nr:sulfatase [Blastopirellula sediminis]MCC9604704.1 sulfatase [Blastopirellula sediminis]MCC9631997.1 sulfatase [Blastopirellula sediminis]
MHFYHCFRALLLAAVVCSWAAAADTPPNIVLILSDDQGWGDYSFMGHKSIQTPNLDRLAHQSLTYTRGYVPDSLCRPSLATIISGLYAHQHGVVGNDPPKTAKGDPSAPYQTGTRNDYLQHIDKMPKLPEILKREKGYVSLQTGKWWEGNFSRGGFDQGMTHGDITRGGRHGDEGLKIGRTGLKPIYDFVREAKADNKPFFLWYAPIMPHTPHTPPERLLAKYSDKTKSLPIAKYWAMCEWFDETCGQLLDFLDEEKLSDNTIVIYICDNGWINLENESKYAPRSKRSQYEGGTRTPIMIRWPGHMSPQMNTTQLASSIDIVPTVLAAVGIEKLPEMEGINLLDAKAVDARDTIYGEILEHDIRAMDDPAKSLMFRWVIEGPWKLIVPYAPNEPNVKIELFNVEKDPTEENNLAAQQPEVVKRLQAKLDAWWAVP